jgi:tetratricopeptide (TPR) repeat protein
MKTAKKVIALVGCLALGIFLSCASNIEQQTAQINKASSLPNLDKIAEIAKAGTVQIGSLNVEGPPYFGSGFFIRHNLIITNIHVVNNRSFDGAVSLVRLVNKPTWFTIKGVMASDPIRDLVILKVTKLGGEDPHILSIGDSDTVKRGDSIIAIGNPGEGDKIVQGDVSIGMIGRRTPNFLEIRARNNRKGYSGGPVLNVHGDVVGIMFAGHRIGAGYAIPSNFLQALLKDMPTQEKSLEKWREAPLIRHYAAEDVEAPERLASAIKDCDLAIQLARDSTDAYLHRGYVKKKLEDFRGAIKDYDTAIRKGADYAHVYVYRGNAKSDAGDKKGAIKDYDKAIRLDTAYVNAYSSRARAKSNLGNKKGAIEDYDAVIRLKPEDNILALAYINRASAKSDLGNKEGIIEDCNAAIALKPGIIVLAAAYHAQGKAKSDKGNNKSGIIDYNKSIQLEPNHPEFYYNRGAANAALGGTSEAETDFKTALKLLKQTRNTSKLTAKGTGSSSWNFYLSVRPNLKADIKKALRDLK